MNNSVIIKGSKDGLTILVNEELRYEEFIEVLKEKFNESRNFFKKATMALAIKGINLTAKQEKQVIDVIEECSDMKILCLLDDDEVVNARFYHAKKNQEFLEKAQMGTFFRGSIRSGEVFESKSSVIILGDVNPGATVICAGNIIVLGKLQGYVFAGADNEDDCFIVALDMQPSQIRINDTSAKAKRRFNLIRSTGPKIAYLNHERIVVDNINEAAYKNIQI